MVIEATMICVDNSEWMRNGDYTPTRLQAQCEAVNLLSGAKTESNPENTVGILTMAGKNAKVCLTPMNDLGRILACTRDLKINGEINLSSAIQIAHLALKHRQNKNQKQRIIVFAGSPIKEDQKSLEMIGMKLKKSSVALDVVYFGDDDDYGKGEKLEALVAAVNTNDTSHIVHVPPGPDSLSDVLIGTPIFSGDWGVGGSGSGSGSAPAAGGYDFGVDPNLDPELALALRVSMEEDKARQEEEAGKKAAEETSSRGQQIGSQDEQQQQISSEDVDNALLQQALSMSVDELSAVRELQDIDMPLVAEDQIDMSNLLADQSFVSAILASLPGVNPNDSSVKDLLDSIRNESEPQEKKKAADEADEQQGSS